MKSKHRQVDFTVDNSAASVAETWLDNMGGGKVIPDKDQEISGDGIKKPRPSRMGLGAKFVPHIDLHSDQSIGKNIEKLKKRSVPDYIFRQSSKDDSDDEGESRTRAIKGKSSKTKQLPATLEPIAKLSAPKKKKKKVQLDLDTEKKEYEDIPLDKAKHPTTDATELTTDAPEEKSGLTPKRAEELARRPPRRKRVKGKKTRSKQKNIRKDNRPDHLKPGFQNPPT